MPGFRRGPLTPGDASSKILRFWTPSFYKDDPVFDSINKVLQIAMLTMDYFLEKARGLPHIVDIRKCPDHLLPDLGALVGYTWQADVPAGVQREEIERAINVYQIKGTDRSVERLVLAAGATEADIFTPYEHIFAWDTSRWDRGHHWEDETFWRWGTYEVVFDIDISKFLHLIPGVHPAGMVWFGRQYVDAEASLSEYESPDPENHVYEYHMNLEDYRLTGSALYAESVVLDGAEGYWRLNELASLEPAVDPNAPEYGTTLYGVGAYGGQTGYAAIDSSGNGHTAKYNTEEEVIGVGNGADVNFPFTLAVTPVTPGELYIGWVSGGVAKRIRSGVSGVSTTSDATLTFDPSPSNDSGVIIFSTPPDDTENIIAFYNDYVDRGVPGALFGSPTTAARFGFSSDLVRSLVLLPNDSELHPSTGSWAVEAWFKANRFDRGSIFGFEWGTAPDVKRVDLRIRKSDGKLVFQVADGLFTADDYSVVSPMRVDDGVWHHAVGVIDTSLGVLRLLRDGTVVAKVSGYNTSIDLSPTTRGAIGARTGIPVTVLMGTGDDAETEFGVTTDEYVRNTGSLVIEWTNQSNEVRRRQAVEATTTVYDDVTIVVGFPDPDDILAVFVDPPLDGAPVNAIFSENFFKGDIDEVAIYLDVLPNDVAGAHYAAGAGELLADSHGITYMTSNIEEGGFGVRGFKLDSSSLGGPDVLDEEDSSQIITSELITWEYESTSTDKNVFFFEPVGAVESVKIIVNLVIQESVTVAETATTVDLVATIVVQETLTVIESAPVVRLVATIVVQETLTIADVVKIGAGLAVPEPITITESAPNVVAS